MNTNQNMQNKNKKLDTLLPYGLLVTRQYLLSCGMNRHAIDNAVKSGKILAILRGVYARGKVPLDWQGLMTSLNIMAVDRSVYVGGVSALELSGLGHYLQNPSKLNIYCQNPKPSWLAYLDLSTEFTWYKTKRIWQDTLLRTDKHLNHVHWREDLPSYLLASNEQACLEFLATVPNVVSFEHADLLFQGLTSLSPRKINIMLQHCKNIKAKRLFFWFAKRHGFQWSKRLSYHDYDLGSGKRVIAENGIFDRELLITVAKL